MTYKYYSDNNQKDAEKTAITENRSFSKKTRELLGIIFIR